MSDDKDMTEENGTELNPSKLGTLDFWENMYAEEIENFKDQGEIDEVWFSGIKLVRYMSNELTLNKESDKIIDIGCGNGKMLLELAKEGFQRLVGVDYCQKAIDLAREVLKSRDVTNVRLEVCDVLNCEDDETVRNFRVVNDKCTYDTISLHPENRKEKRQKYVDNISKFLLPKGYFIVTSCNWTKEELVEHFQKYFELIHEVPTKTFSFGGKTGNRVTQLIFVKK